MFWVDAELGSDVYLDGKFDIAATQCAFALCVMKLDVGLNSLPQFVQRASPFFC